jgi:hypothetical protein
MTTEVMKREETGVANYTKGGEEIIRADALIPRLLLMQGLSDFVSDRKAQQGDMVRSTTIEKLGDPEVPVELIPITYQNRWRLEEEIKGKFEYRGTEARTAKNDDQPWEFMHQGAKWKRTKVIDLYAVLPQDIAAEQNEKKRFQETGELPDLNKTLMPVLVSFRASSYQAGKKIVDIFMKAQNFGVQPHHYKTKLKCHQESNDKGTYYVFDLEGTKPVTTDEKEISDRWKALLSVNMDKFKVHDAEEGENAEATSNSQF